MGEIVGWKLQRSLYFEREEVLKKGERKKNTQCW